MKSQQNNDIYAIVLAAGKGLRGLILFFLFDPGTE
jgi:hypothetical protein